ncbi:MAG: hypothetical protein ACOZNI_20135 [Myxococcota bacterium]
MLALTIHGNTEHLPEEERDTAMRRYFEAFQQGDVTAKLIRVDDPPANGPMPTTPDDPDDDPPPTAPGAVSKIAEERISLQEDWLQKAGFALAPPLYAPGTRVLPLGDRNFRLERQRVEALPPWRGAASSIIATVAHEKRENRSVPLRDLALTDHGTLTVGEEEVALEVGAFYQLAFHAGFGMGARYLAERCDAELRATNVNAQFKKHPGKVVTLRLRETGGDYPQAFATVTPTYAVADTDAALQVVSPLLEDSRAEVYYDGTGVRATALWMPDQVVDLAAGDIFKAGVRIETDDTGRGRIRVSAVVWRNRCLNLLVIGQGVVETVSQVHRGSSAKILDAVKHGVEAAREKVSDFLDAWGKARSLKTDPEKLIRMWVEEKELQVPGERNPDAIVEALLAAWRKEPGDSYADAVNAVTRAAHENPLWGVNIREELERQAARLVYVPR